MKVLTIILSLYILTLNFIPCEDVVVLDSSDTVNLVQSSLDNHGHVDMCSPFCQCHCCHINATYYAIVEVELPSPDISANLILYFNSLGKDISRSFLQPPRV
ncbi:hypothetical protein M4I21_02345 [Cellulophaga sp. 20_2_10]|uniref:DUF6660 family protein n=1 Tax=Cellulophaga sp. 20_2_10 TaxID=2942476 RepID=UPI00201ACB7D|nr:DUF6660 family protein [Cellulophaga sp. 20_2_10]MCL5244631.1 hypothetical protein [Cellulophaga sp. 20_2_10]